jgi:hypothetical protein
MTTNGEVFSKDPTHYTIPNNGVAQVVDPHTEKEWAILRYELENFVCKGEYKRGLELILSTYLTHLRLDKQPAVWVSGFYGSGKSHFVRMLEYLWRDTVFPSDGARARDVATLPDDIKDLLHELSTIGRREGGLWSAAGTLGAGAGNSIRLALLGILFRSAGLPEQYAPACFAIWLKQHGYYEDVKATFERRKPDSDFFRELNNLYASSDLAESLLAVHPEYAKNQLEARAIFRAQYPRSQEEITDDEMLRTMEDVLKLQSNQPGKLPCTLIVCDELQQYIGQDPSRTFDVQTVVETCCSRFGTRLLFVATGQAAIQGTPQLEKLQGRFTTQVMLNDADVEQVVRNVVLLKKPAQIAPLQAVLTNVSGEIDRHLAGTSIAANSTDRAKLVPDYPLLPVRSRFWERFLRGVDSSGTTGQLRTQLRIVHEAIKEIADKPIGTVVAGDVIYNQLKVNMIQRSMLLPDVEMQIAQLDDGTSGGKLSARLCATVFLIGKLLPDTLKDTGIRSDVNTLADLLVEDLITGSAPLRQRIPELLQTLVANRVLMQVGDEYRIQTREGREWEAEYHRRYERALADGTRLGSERTEEFRRVIRIALKGVSSPLQGQSKTARKLFMHFDQSFPADNGAMVPVWIRDEWNASEKAVREDAQRVGMDSPIVFVFLPQQDTDALSDALASYAAANETAASRMAPGTAEGLEAKAAMQSRSQMAQTRRDTLIEKIVKNARVFQGGGNEVLQGTLQLSVKEAVDDALIRLFPHFILADHPSWGTVVKRAREGAADALSSINNYNGNVEDHPVCREVRSFIDIHGKKGNDIRKHFMGVGYGWPQDAVDGALLCLVVAGFLRAIRLGLSIPVKDITAQNIGLTEFYREGVTVTALHRINIRKLLSGLGLTIRQGEEAESLPRALNQLLTLAASAGGDAPLPERPATASIEYLQRLSGNEQIVTVSDQRDELLSNFQTWSKRRDQIAQRLPEWTKLQRLFAHVRSLPIAAQVGPQIEAIISGRHLLFEPDPLLPLINNLTTVLRATIVAYHQRIVEEQDRQVKTLDTWTEWQRMTEQDRLRILSQYGLTAVPALQIGTDEELLATLDANPISSWEDKIAVPQARIVKVREATMQLLTPQAVRVFPPQATLTSTDQVDAYLTQLRATMMQHIEAGNPVVI